MEEDEFVRKIIGQIMTIDECVIVRDKLEEIIKEAERSKICKGREVKEDVKRIS